MALVAIQPGSAGGHMGWLWVALATYVGMALDDQRHRNAVQEGCWWRRTDDHHFHS